MNYFTPKTNSGIKDSLAGLIKTRGDLFDHRISNEIRSRDIEALIPVLTQTDPGAIFSISPSTGLYLAGLSHASHLIIADWMPHLVRFGVLYLNLLALLQTPERVGRSLNENPALTFWRSQLWQHMPDSEKEILLDTQPSRQSELISDHEIIQLFKNLNFHYVLEKSYLRDRNQMQHLLHMHQERKIQYIKGNVFKADVRSMIASGFGSEPIPAFSVFYLSNILEWLPGDQFQENQAHVSGWINALPHTAQALIVRSACRGLINYQTWGNEIVSKNGGWFYLITRSKRP